MYDRRRAHRGMWCALLSLASPARVEAQPLTDVQGSKDPAAIKRYEGSVIIGYKFSKFDEFTFLVGPLAPSKAIGGFDLHKETFGRPVILVDFIEPLGMETKMVTVDASAMAKGIASDGHVALYGILFDTDKTDIKPESAATIAEIAKFLTQEAGVKLYVVGHTDNVGVYDDNMGLSQRRAAAVVTELTTKHGIPAARLKPAGSGPLAPVAPNETEAGRAKNRRVELVKQ